jgi:hypothetical protein
MRNKIIKIFEAHDLFDVQGSPRPADNGMNMWHSYPSTDYAMLETTKKPRIYVDMDKVIVDFPGAFFTKMGCSPEEYESKVGKSAFWNLIKSWGDEFWATLPWMPDGKELWNYVLKYEPIILSAAMASYQRKGKAEWLKNEVGYTDKPIEHPLSWKGQSKIIFHKDKFAFVIDPTDILIDDTPRKIDGWINNGGVGILHKSAQDTIAKLKEMGL